MNKKKEKSPYATLKTDKISAPKKPQNEPKGRKISTGGDMRANDEVLNSESDIQNKENVEEVIPEAEPKRTTSHLSGSIPRRVETPRGAMTKAEMREARELFRDLDDAEIHRLYKKVTQ